jgi:tetratricopeptide (TPR) repeat protein
MRRVETREVVRDEIGRRAVERDAAEKAASGGKALQSPRNADSAAGFNPGSALLPPVLIVLGTLIYVTSLPGVFVFDDLIQILQHTDVHSLAGLTEIVSGTSRPLLDLSLALNYSVSGQLLRGYHLVNISIHLAASLALFGIVRRTLSFGSLRARYGADAAWLAFAVASIWMLHPLQTQAVTCIYYRSESMMGMFLLLTLYCAIRCAQARHGSRTRYAWGLAAAVACALGMATKEVMVVAPIVVLLYDRIFLATSFRDSLRQRWGLHLAVATGWTVMFATLGTGGSLGGSFPSPHPATASRLEYALTQPGVICHYLRLAIWPHPLCFDYYWPAAKQLDEILLPSLAIAALVLGSAWALWRGGWLGFLGACFFVILAPTSSLAPLADMAAEHRMYLPLAPVVALVVILVWEGLARLEGRRAGVALALLSLVASLLAYATAQRNFDYWGHRKLWQSVVDVRPDNPRAHHRLGELYAMRLEQESAAAHFLRAVELEPTSEKHYALGYSLQKALRFREAVHHYQEAVRLDPTSLRAQMALAAAYHSAGEFELAIEHYRSFLHNTESLDPGSDPSVPNLRAEARSFLELALRGEGQAPLGENGGDGAAPE